MTTLPDTSRRRSRRLWLALWFIASLISGLTISLIPWGTPSAFHGTGFPIPVVLWDRDPATGQFLDYLNLLGLVENPLIIFLVGIVVWLLVCFVWFLWRRISSSTTAE